MSTSPVNGTSSRTSENGADPALASGNGDNVDVEVNVSEAVGTAVLGVMVLLLLFALLRAIRRERKLMERIIEIQTETPQ